MALLDWTRRKIELTEAGKVSCDDAAKFDAAHTALLADLTEFRVSRPELSIAAIPVIVPIQLVMPVESNIVVAYPKNRKLSRAATMFLNFRKNAKSL